MISISRTGFVAAGLAALVSAIVLGLAGPAAVAEGRRETSPFSEQNKSDSDGSDVKEFFQGLDFGFGGGDDDEDADAEGTYVSRFEVPEFKVFEELKAQRRVNLAIQRSSGLGLVSSKRINAYLNSVLKRIVKTSPVPALDARAHVRADPRFAALSTPDGSIFINIGLLQDVESEDELAAVLAHELAHVLYRHHGADWFENSQKIAAQVLSLKDYAQGMVEGSQVSKDSKSVLLVSFASEMSERVVAPNLWNREQEREADGLGLDLLVAAGYLSSAATTSLERLAFYEAEAHERARRQLQEVAKSAEADMNESIESGDLSQIVVGLVKGAGAALGAASDAAIDAVGGGDHDPAEVRVDRLRDYINREYLLAPRPKPTGLPWQSPADPTAVVLANYRSASEAGGALAEGKLDKAESLVRAAVGAPTKADAYPRMIFFQVRDEQGDFTKAYKNLEIASTGPEPAFAIYDLMIRKQLAGGRPDEAVRLVGEASQRLDEPPNLYPYRIAVLVDAKKQAEATALFAECKLSYPDLAPICNRALGGLRRAAAEKGESDESASQQLLDREVTDPAGKAAKGFAQ